MSSAKITVNAKTDATRHPDTFGNAIRLIQIRTRAVLSEHSEDKRLTALADVLAQVGGLGVLAFCRPSSSGWSLWRTEVRCNDDVMWPKLDAIANRLADQVSVIARLTDSTQAVWRAIALRVRTTIGDPAGLIVTFRESTFSDESLVALMEVVGLELAIARSEDDRRLNTIELDCSTAVLELASNLESCDSLAEACQLFVERVANYLNATVAMGLLNSSSANCELRAVSGVAGIDSHSARSHALAAALNEVVIHEEPTCWPPLDPMGRQSLLTHRRLVDEQLCQSVLGMPIKDARGNLLGSWVCLGDGQLSGNLQVRGFLRACEFRLGPTLHLLQRAERSRWQRMLDRLRHFFGGSLRRVTCISLVLLSGVLAIPWPHRLKCKSELQPVTRRFIAAPFEGTLEKAFVEPGDVVQQGDLLARIDDREINWEMAGVDAEQQKALKEQDSRLAKHEIAASQLAHFDAERLELRKRLLNHRGEHLEIRSPIAGLVLVGDLKRSEGAPLSVGTNLFEIAPLDRMIVEVAIPERDSVHASVGQKVDLTLEGFLGSHWGGTLLRIHPRSEMRERENVFIGEFELENLDGRLLPGMHGQARLEGKLRPLVWLMFHRAWESLVFSMGW